MVDKVDIFDAVDRVDTFQIVDTGDNADIVDTVDTLDTVDIVDTVETVDITANFDTVDIVDKFDIVDTIDIVDIINIVDTHFDTVDVIVTLLRQTETIIVMDSEVICKFGVNSFTNGIEEMLAHLKTIPDEASPGLQARIQPLVCAKSRKPKWQGLKRSASTALVFIVVMYSNEVEFCISLHTSFVFHCTPTECMTLAAGVHWHGSVNLANFLKREFSPSSVRRLAGPFSHP